MLSSAEDKFLETTFFHEAIERYLESLIELKGHAWCMDVQEERHKMAHLAAGILENAVALKREVRAINQIERMIRCACGRDIVLQMIKAKHPDSYSGKCTCRKRWFLTDLPVSFRFK